jgi:putative hydrolase of the HAD superfamily
MTIKAIIWDIGGVLLRMRDEAPRLELAAQFNLPLDRIYQAIFNSPSARLAGLGRISLEQHWQAVQESLSIPVDRMPQFLESFWSVDNIDYQLIDLIRSLRKIYRTGVLSNAWDNLRGTMVETWKIADAFDAIVNSAEVGLAKPDPLIFHRILEKLQVSAQEAIFIDDIQENVLAARKEGVIAIQYQSRAQMLSELEGMLTADQELDVEVSDRIRALVKQPPFPPGDARQLIRLQVALEYQVDTDGLFIPFPGSTEQAYYLVYQATNGFEMFFQQNLPAKIRRDLAELGAESAFTRPEAVLKILSGQKPIQRSGPFQVYTFYQLPNVAGIDAVTRKGNHFEIYDDRKPVSRAWSIRENACCAEVAVETISAYRRRGFARQVTAAWVHAIIQQGKTPFYSHLESNKASRLLARSLGAIEFAQCACFE